MTLVDSATDAGDAIALPFYLQELTVAALGLKSISEGQAN